MPVLDRYKALLSALPGVAFIINGEGRYLEVMGTDRDGFYAAKSELAASTIWDIFEPELAGAFMEVVERALNSGELELYEYQLDVLRGLRWFEARVQRIESAPVASVLWLAFDVTERKVTEQALRDSQARIEAVLSNTRDLIVAYDTDLRILMFNEAARVSCADLLGIELAVGMDLTGALSTRSTQGRMYWGEIATRGISGESFTTSYDSRGIEGMPDLVLESSVSPILDREGEVTGFVVVTRDTTERALLERRMQEIEKMNAIGQLAGGVAHDFNNQLMCVMGYASVLASTVEDPSARHCIEMIQQVGHRSARLTSQLLAFARRGQYQEVVVDMHEIVTEVRDLLERSIDRRIEISVDLRASPKFVYGDPSQLQNALLNMTLNARDAMPSGGRLEINTSNEAPPAQLVDETPEHGWLCVCVADDGIGMSPETARRAFEPFFTTKPPGSGTGMGLASVYGTIKNHGGIIDVDSAPGEGSRFRAYLPTTTERAVERISTETPSMPPRVARIMVVEDNRDVAHALQLELGQAGHTVEVFERGREAIAAFAAVVDDPDRRFDIAVLDLMMPQMTGREVFQALEALDSDLRAIAISGFSVEAMAKELQDHPNVEFLQKPFRGKKLHAAVARALESATTSATTSAATSATTSPATGA